MPGYLTRYGRPLGGLAVLLLACQLGAPARAADLPGFPGWSSVDIGTSIPGYTIAQPNGTLSIAGSGADIGKLGDAFRYTYIQQTGDFSLTCRVTRQTNTDASAKIGVMIRDTLDPGSRHFMLVRMPANGVDPMWRADMAQQTLDFKPKAYSGTLPVWLRVQRTGSLFMAFASRDGATWKQVGSVVQISMGAQVLAGVCLTAHNDDQVCYAEVDNITISPDVVVLGPDHLQGFPGSHSALLSWYGIPNAKGYNVYRLDSNGPVKLNSQPLANWFYVDTGGSPDGLPDNQPQRYQVTAVLDRGESLPSAAAVVTPMQPVGGLFMGYDMNTATPGHVSLDPAKGVVTVAGSGSDIFDNFDRMYFAATPARGAVELTARILDRPFRTDASAKAGLMIRETLEDSARNVFICATPDKGLNLQWRHDPRGGTANSSGGTNDTYPLFLRIRRLGDLINCYRSDDGTVYERVGTTIKLDNLAQDVFIGFAVTAHREGATTHADFDRIVLK